MVQVAISADVVVGDMEDVADSRRALKEQHDGSHLLSALVCANQAAYDSSQPLQANSAIESLGTSMKDALIIKAPSRKTQVQEAVENAAFMIVDDHAGAATAVFFTSTLAATCDHNLTEHHTVGSTVSLVWKENKVDTTVVARNPQLNFAILKSSTPRPYIPLWNGNPSELEGIDDLELVYPFELKEFFNYDGLIFNGASGMSLPLYEVTVAIEIDFETAVEYRHS
ncbi:hypothetical protein P3T76_014387 [Phytophthora citrophthora]|uniref:Uncharacterized protein n=1 Tax=Phytophthora citrophthora TaxID=4793 RepID=A0AAD9G1C5_9STRA|nr:hypothetical protein P3T76_014387 [Phytophthora citrophthora]